MKKKDIRIKATDKLKVTDAVVSYMCDSTTVLVKKHQKGDFDGLIKNEKSAGIFFTIVGIRNGRMPTTDKKLSDALPGLFVYVDDINTQMEWLNGKEVMDDGIEVAYMKFMLDAIIGKLLRDRG